MSAFLSIGRQPGPTQFQGLVTEQICKPMQTYNVT